jgi:hypothetical protein
VDVDLGGRAESRWWVQGVRWRSEKWGAAAAGVAGEVTGDGGEERLSERERGRRGGGVAFSLSLSSPRHSRGVWRAGPGGSGEDIISSLRVGSASRLREGPQRKVRGVVTRKRWTNQPASLTRGRPTLWTRTSAPGAGSSATASVAAAALARSVSVVGDTRARLRGAGEGR